MKKLTLILMLFAVSVSAFAQKNRGGTFKATAGPHSVTLTWTASTDSTSAMTYTVLRSQTSGTETSYATGVATACSGASCTYTDTAVTPGKYFYTVQAVLNGVNSASSNEASASIPVAAPTGLTGTGN